MENDKLSLKNRGEALYARYLELEKLGKSELSREYLKNSFELGEPMAAHALGYYSFNEENNISQMLFYYEHAAKNKFSPSMWNLARYYELIPDAEKYKYWLTQCAEMDEEDAIEEASNPWPYLREKIDKMRKEKKFKEIRNIKNCLNMQGCNDLELW